MGTIHIAIVPVLIQLLETETENIKALKIVMEDANELIVRDTAPGQAWPQVNLRFVVFFYTFWDGDLPCTAEQILAFLFHLLEDLQSRKKGLQFLSAESNPFKLGMSAFIEKCGKVCAT